MPVVSKKLGRSLLGLIALCGVVFLSSGRAAAHSDWRRPPNRPVVVVRDHPRAVFVESWHHHRGGPPPWAPAHGHWRNHGSPGYWHWHGHHHYWHWHLGWSYR